ncbi:dihydroxyacetone kinase transcriptional activator DhaS [Lacticaseibacillus saniviri]
MSYIVQKKIATATKELMSVKPFSQLSVTTIMAEAHLRRQTFYDYFEDKYAVLAWIYNDDIQAIIKDNLDYEHWTVVLHHMLHYFQANQAFYQKALAIHDQNAPEQAISEHITQLIERVLTEFSHKENVKLSPAYRDFLQKILTASLVSELRQWIMSPTPRPLDLETKYLQTFLEDMTNGVVLRHQHDPRYLHQPFPHANPPTGFPNQ